MRSVSGISKSGISNSGIRKGGISKKLPSAKRLTFLYFAMVAFSIIVIHMSVVELTTDDLERLYVQNRMEQLESHTATLATRQALNPIGHQQLQTQGQSDFDHLVDLYFDVDTLPHWMPDPDALDYGVGEIITLDKADTTYFVMKTTLTIDGNKLDAILIEDNSLWELSEEQLLNNHSQQLLISFVLLVCSLLVVLTISGILTNPVSQLIKQLASKKPDDFSPIVFQKAPATQELAVLLSTFNRYLQRIETLLQRERKFSRYASHELRTPLMVMKGALSLMGEKSDPAFIEKQRQRILKATDDMSEFTESLLTLGKTIDLEQTSVRAVSEAEVKAIAAHHQHLISRKPVEWRLNYINPLETTIPESMFKLLLGNILKNAFAYTSQGSVETIINRHQIEVVDTGKGLAEGIAQGTAKPDGYGLGLLLVQDICKQYGVDCKLGPNQPQGCRVTLTF